MTTSSKGILFAGLLLIAAAGCTTVGGKELRSQPFVPPGDAAAAAAPTVSVEFWTASGKRSKSVTVPLEPGMTVQDLVDKTKAGSRYHRCYLDLGRSVAGGELLKMKVDFQNGTSRVAHAKNYALHPGDRLIVTEDPTTVLDDAVAKLFGKKKTRR